METNNTTNRTNTISVEDIQANIPDHAIYEYLTAGTQWYLCLNANDEGKAEFFTSQSREGIAAVRCENASDHTEYFANDFATHAEGGMWNTPKGLLCDEQLIEDGIEFGDTLQIREALAERLYDCYLEWNR